MPKNNVNKDLLQSLPSVCSLLADPRIREQDLPLTLKKQKINIVLTALRENIASSNELDVFNYDSMVDKILNLLLANQYQLHPVINATGTVLHTNLGRSVLSDFAIQNIVRVCKSYCNLEYDLKDGTRGSRYDHVTKLICLLTGAQDALVVNNNAAAIFLALNSFDHELGAIVSRGELVEIGEGFRIGSIMELAGLKITEIGSTNCTHDYDYEAAMAKDERARIVVKVHRSNYTMNGFVKDVDIDRLALMKSKYPDLKIIVDQGSGFFLNQLSQFAFNKNDNTVKDALRKGADLVLFSGDKLLGSAQAGIIVGSHNLIAPIRHNQLLRTMRVSKLTLSALEADMLSYLDDTVAIQSIPTLKMIMANEATIKLKVKRFLRLVTNKNFVISEIKIESTIGGGAIPGSKINSFGVALTHSTYSSQQLADAFRHHPKSVIGRIFDNKFCFDFRTLNDDEILTLVEIINGWNNGM